MIRFVQNPPLTTKSWEDTSRLAAENEPLKYQLRPLFSSSIIDTTAPNFELKFQTLAAIFCLSSEKSLVPSSPSTWLPTRIYQCDAY